MTLDRRFLNWGVFFIVLGAVPLAVRANLLSRDVLTGAWRLWPLILIGLGLGILLRRTPAVVAGGVVVAATFGLVFGSALAVGPDVAVNCGGTPGAGLATDQHGTFGGSADVQVHLGCGSVNVSTANGNDWTLHSTNTGNVAPIVDSGPSSLSIRSGRTSNFGIDVRRDDWQLALPTGSNLGLSVEVSAGKGTLDLASAHLGGFDLTVNAGDAKVDLSAATAENMSVTVNAGSASIAIPEGSDTRGSLTVNAGGLNICAPAGVGLRLDTSQGLGGTNFDSQGLTKSGNVWSTSNYGTAAHNADLSISANLGGVTLNPTGGCK